MFNALVLCFRGTKIIDALLVHPRRKSYLVDGKCCRLNPPLLDACGQKCDSLVVVAHDAAPILLLLLLLSLLLLLLVLLLLYSATAGTTRLQQLTNSDEM